MAARVVRAGPRARAPGGDQGALRALRRRRAGDPPLQARGAGRRAGVRPSPRGHDLRRRRPRGRDHPGRARRRLHRHGAPGRRHRGRRAAPRRGQPRGGAAAGCARPRRRWTTPTPAGSCTATSSRPTSCSIRAATCTWPTSGSPGWPVRRRSPAPATCSGPPRISPPNRRWATTRRRPVTATRSPSPPTSCSPAGGRSPRRTSPPRRVSTSTMLRRRPASAIRISRSPSTPCWSAAWPRTRVTATRPPSPLSPRLTTPCSARCHRPPSAPGRWSRPSP